MVPTTYTCSPEEFLKNARLPVRIVENESVMMEEIAQIMFDTIAQKNEGALVIICPVGPVAQYPILAEKINAAKLDLSEVWFINMDEYLDDNDQNTSDQNLSFHCSMEANFYSRLLPELRPPVEHCLFPDPNDPSAVDDLIERLGGAELSLTGVGINGHIAFNESAEPSEDITDEEFSALPTRVRDIAMATIVNNGSRKIHGALDIFPKRCVTLGMKQLLACRKLKIYLYCDWQWGVMRKLSLEEPSRFCPASFLQNHPDAEMVISRELYEYMLF